MNRFLKPFLAVAVMAACCVAARAESPVQARPVADHTAAPRLLDFELHGLVGGTTVTQNYRGCFPEISEMSLEMGVSAGIGAAATANFSRFLGLGLEINALANNYRLNAAVADDNGSSITNVFMANRFVTLNFPVYATMRFDVGPAVVWNIDAGLYYAYGLTGRQRASFYSAWVNPLGQLVATVTSERNDYYNSPLTFINSFKRGDYGLHLAMGLRFNDRVKIGLRSQLGFRQASETFNAVRRPKVHNFSFALTAGWCF